LIFKLNGVFLEDTYRSYFYEKYIFQEHYY
jgi:hypothetical protein